MSTIKSLISKYWDTQSKMRSGGIYPSDFIRIFPNSLKRVLFLHKFGLNIFELGPLALAFSSSL